MSRSLGAALPLFKIRALFHQQDLPSPQILQAKGGKQPGGPGPDDDYFIGRHNSIFPVRF